MYTHTHTYIYTHKMCSVIFSINYNNIKKNRSKGIGCPGLFVYARMSTQCHM